MTLKSIKIVIGVMLTLWCINPYPVSAEKKVEPLSVFEEYVKEKKGKLPTPFSALIQDFAKWSGFDQVALLGIPDGRSLQKDKASFEDPRMVVAFGANTSTGPKNSKWDSYSLTTPLFLGYVESTGQIEAISLVPETGKTKFHLVSNYDLASQGNAKTSVPVFENANPDVCKTCHQAEGPIFSRFPWDETTGNSSGNGNTLNIEIARQRKAAGKSDNLPGQIDSSEAMRKFIKENIGDLKKPLTGQDLIKFQNQQEENDNARPFSSAFSFDDNVRHTQAYVQNRRICQDICKEDDKECRATLIKGAALAALERAGSRSIGGSGDDRDPIWKARLKFENQFAKVKNAQWPKDGFAYPSTVLPDRNPMIMPEEGGIVEYKYDEHAKSVDPTFNEASSRDSFIGIEDKNGNFRGAQSKTEVGVRPNSYGNPATPRPLEGKKHKGKLFFDAAFRDTSRLRIVSQACLGWSSQIMNEVAQMAPQYLEAIEAMDFTEAATAPLNGALAFKMLKEQVVKKIKTSKQCQECSYTGPKQAPDSTLEEFNEVEKIKEGIEKTASGDSDKENTGAMKLFQKYCGKCHKSGDHQLPLKDSRMMKAYRDSEGKTITDRLEEGSMPPASARQPTAKEKETMKKFIESR